MAKFKKPVNAFVAGELSPRFRGRVNSDQYEQGAEQILNKIVRPQGGAARRMGTVMLDSGIRSSNQTPTNFDTEIRAIDFRFSRNDASVVVLSTGNNGLNNYGIAIWVPSVKQWVNPVITLSTGYKAFTGWTTQDQLDKVQYSQTGDVMVLVSKVHPPLFLTRTSATDYELKDIYSVRDFLPTTRAAYSGSAVATQEKLSPSAPPSTSQPYYNVPYRLMDSGLYGTASAGATTGTMTLTMSTQKLGELLGIGGGGAVGTIIRMTKSGVTGFVQVLASSGFTATVLVLKTLGGTGVQDSWEVQDFGVGEEYWPQVVGFHDQRIWYGNTVAKPNTFWASQVGDYTEMMITRPADDANFSAISNDRPFSYNLAGNQIDELCWFVSNKNTLFIGTSGGEWLGLPSSTAILGPLNPNFQPQTSYGSKLMQAARINGSVLFVDRTGLRLREFIYNRDVDNYRAVDLNYFADHMIKKGLDLYASPAVPEIMALAVQAGEREVLFVRDSNGLVHALTKDKDYGTLAWSTLKFGGSYNAAGEPAKCFALVGMPNDAANDDDIYFLISRYLNSTSKIYFEKFGGEFYGPSVDSSQIDIQNQPVFMDAARIIHNVTSPLFFGRFVSSIDADYWTTSKTGVGTNSPTASDGLVLTGNTVKYVTYNAANALNMQDHGTIVFEVTPNYSGTPSANRYFFSISRTNLNDNNLVEIHHATASGNLICAIKNEDSSITKTLTLAAWSPASGQKYQIMVSWDATTGSYKLKINGITVATASGAMTRNSNIGQFVIGTDFSKAATSQFTINKFAMGASSIGTTLAANAIKPCFAIDKYVIGASHLFGAGQVLTDGQYRGLINLETDNLPVAITNKGLVGLGYVSRLKPSDIEAGSVLGSSQGEVKRAHEVTFRFERTIGAKYGADGGTLDSIKFNPQTYTSGAAPEMFTGDITLKNFPGYGRNINIVIEQDLPYPCNITAMFIKGMTYD